MRHRKEGRTLGRTKTEREAMMRNLADSLIVHGSISTTLAKAKELRRVVEPLVTKAKSDTLAARRNARKTLYTDGAVRELFQTLGPRYKDRNGGYTRIVKTGARSNDAAETAVIEFVV
ncbi:MAG: 50S ribosomal protein L17 [Candidatus Magasanikbacteria bacterium RIFCSPHIGHO2_02_FULL_51_14]|uniref:Large ribosomal subunit protein bL17 n=1 Tax=Candidatus Magasanikbacteria bacterium RIFCSPHIGHO2_02_FULL_51_14 TaxID=1798683 RepID=A0A1F6MQ35_9BACT|nr:MAG: 50S ribosomal protein L17 [Candidatus Magasanikbacteria bacterium RIFCSPHIGHO2_02_FULL_51_14]